jgi:hypothetical protein
LYVAASEGKLEIVKCLLDLGADINMPVTEPGNKVTAFTYDAERSKLSTYEYQNSYYGLTREKASINSLGINA